MWVSSGSALGQFVVGGLYTVQLCMKFGSLSVARVLVGCYVIVAWFSCGSAMDQFVVVNSVYLV